MILAIESSCDESALALFSRDRGIVYEAVQSQLDLHKKYGGVVPALSSRQHLKAFGPILADLIQKHPEWSENLDTIAVTHGPGLAGCLTLGVSAAKTLALALNIPLVGVNHLRAHAFSPFIELHNSDPKNFKEKLKTLLPHLGLIASGGNTLLFELNSELEITILAETVDDACGEALDKGAKLLGMPYPGGALIEKEARLGDPKSHPFPVAFAERNEMKFSFSGLKTSLRYLLEKMDDAQLEKEFQNICASYQESVINALTNKTAAALKKNSYKSLGLSGGVSNNQKLSQTFRELAHSKKIECFIPKAKHTGDNASMIAFTAWIDKGTQVDKNYNLTIYPNLRLV